MATVEPADARLWWQKWRWYERGRAPWNRVRLDWELARRRAYARHPLHGNVLELLRDGRLELGEHCMLANGCFVTDADHRFEDPVVPVPWQGFTSRGPTRIGANVWLGANVVVTSGVTIGERCVVGANAVVTHDLPARCVAVGAPAHVVRSLGTTSPA